MFKRIPGTKDILSGEVSWWQEIESIARGIFSLYNYKEIRPPLIEEESLFNRSLGESTEIVLKQMFQIKHGEDIYALRPEGTASIVRAYIENSLDKTDGFSKLYYIGPMFRLERPQKGRLRQFHHLGCEVIGSSEPGVDVEVISLADYLLKSFKIDGYTIKLNSLGCPQDKKKLAESVRQALKKKADKLCEDCQRRLEGNVLRIMDCKNQGCQEIVKGLGVTDSHLCPDCKSHFEKVKEGLDALKVGYQLTPHLVRGLDYYTGTVFEISHDALGAQDALGAGGRYDNLVKELGGPDLGAVGFAFGMERLLIVAGGKLPLPERNISYIITLGEEAGKYGAGLLNDLRKEGIACDTDYENKSLKGALRSANDLKARFVLIIGDDELKKGIVTLKDMASGEQKEVRAEDLIKELKC